MLLKTEHPVGMSDQQVFVHHDIALLDTEIVKLLQPLIIIGFVLCVHKVLTF